MESLYALGISTLVNATCTEIKENGVVVEMDGEKKEIAADYVVMSVGTKSADYEEIKTYCGENSIPYHVIGDVVRARRALNAIEEAAKLARII